MSKRSGLTGHSPSYLKLPALPQCASVAAIHAVFPAGRGVKCRHLRIKKRDGCVRTGAPERTARLLADASHCSLCVCPCQAAEGAVWRQEGASSPWQAREQAVAGAERWLTLVCSTGRACMLSCCVPMRRLMIVECTPEHIVVRGLSVPGHNSASHEALDLIVGVLSA